MDILKNDYLFDTHNVRIATDESGEPWFIAKDVLKALGIAWDGARSTDAVPNDCQKTENYPTTKGLKEAIFINEEGLYTVIFRSNKTNAVKFRRWICGEVLPQIRKTGSYDKALELNHIIYGKPLDFNQIIKLEAHLLKLTTQINQAKSEFERDLLIGRLQSTCSSLGQSMPNIKLIENKLNEQPRLPLGDN